MTKPYSYRQKLIGLGKGLATDDVLLRDLKLKQPAAGKPCSFILVGTPEAEIFKDPHEFAEGDLPNVVDDFEAEFSHQSREWRSNIENSENLKLFSEKTQVHFINERRQKKLLVLDLDHTLLDFSRHEAAAEAWRRPHLDTFLARVYPHYDIAIWSQTSWMWLEIKLTELGMLSHPAYRLCFVLDKTSMFSVKPLKIIWSKFPQWNEGNSLIIDDLQRNFVLNPQQGLKV
ncbi:unnamed protein product, partial [Chrysoparadoxa australica]